MSETRAATATRDASRTLAAGLLAWVFPGLGHLFLGRKGKGLVLMGSILALFVHGVMIPYSEVVCFALGEITKFGCPATPARLAMPHPSLHQSRVYEQGPMRSCF